MSRSICTAKETESLLIAVQNDLDMAEKGNLKSESEFLLIAIQIDQDMAEKRTHEERIWISFISTTKWPGYGWEEETWREKLSLF